MRALEQQSAATDTAAAAAADASSHSADHLGSKAVWRERLLARLYAASAHHGNSESLLHLGSCYFKGSCDVGAPDYERAQWLYSKASHAEHALSSAYLGAMHHFGIGGLPVNTRRAERYYEHALLNAKDKDAKVVGMVQSLKYALSMKGYSFLAPINSGVDYVVRTLWNM